MSDLKLRCQITEKEYPANEIKVYGLKRRLEDGSYESYRWYMANWVAERLFSRDELLGGN